MSHFRGQIRGPHWGPTMDNLLIDFWQKHECLYNSSASSYNDKDLKTRLWSEFASSVGKSGNQSTDSVFVYLASKKKKAECKKQLCIHRTWFVHLFCAGYKKKCNFYQKWTDYTEYWHDNRYIFDYLCQFFMPKNMEILILGWADVNNIHMK